MLNNFCGMGRITRQPELHEGNVKVCAFTIACERDKDHTDFIPCVAWRNNAEFVSRYFKKGDMIAVEGRLENNSYNKDGERKDKWQVNITRVNFCGGSGKKEQTPLGEAKPESVFYDESDEGPLPF